MAYCSWYGKSFECAGEDEGRQARKKQPFFMLECSKIPGASYKEEVSKINISDITAEGYLYYLEAERKYFCLQKHCCYLLGVFDSENKRIFQRKFDDIKEKSKVYEKISSEYKKIEGCITYQNIVTSFLSRESQEYQKSSELVSTFKEKHDELKEKKEQLEKEIEGMILEYIIEELRILTPKTTGINIQGTLHHYVDFFINKKYYK
jgi:hypothetical protein